MKYHETVKSVMDQLSSQFPQQNITSYVTRWDLSNTLAVIYHDSIKKEKNTFTVFNNGMSYTLHFSELLETIKIELNRDLEILNKKLQDTQNIIVKLDKLIIDELEKLNA